MSDVLYTIGFTGKTAKDFFTRLKESATKRVLDVRLNNVSQLAGFSKKDDLRFFLREIAAIDYIHLPILAPTPEMLDEYRKEKGGWERYERKFRGLIKERRIEEKLSREIIHQGCFLCSEDKPHFCHRRIIAEYLHEKWGDIELIHL